MSIILCCEEKILQKLSFEETLLNVKELESFFDEHIPEKSCIAIFMTHNIHIPALILSMKNCGHIFVPMSTNESEQEIQDLVEEANIQYMISLENIKSFKNFELLSSIFLGKEKVILSKTQTGKKSCSRDASLLCIIPTSGTTGKRKLIRIESYCIEKNVSSLSKIFTLNEKDIIFYGTPLTFDPSLVELFLALKSKATLLIVPEQTKLNPESLFRTLFCKTSECTNITFLQTVPSLFTRWSDKQIQYILKESQLKYLVLGGEPFPSKILKFDRSLKLYNIYGITEISCWATISEVKDDNEIFLGDSLEETYLKVCRDEEDIQEGIGELFLGSETRFCYVDDETEKVKWRRTGDLVKTTSKGIKYLGRNDGRVKRLGHQVFPSLIEKKIFDEMELTTKCIWHEKISKLLLFFLIPQFNRRDISKILHKLRVKLLDLLPTEEFPDFIDLISTFPVTHNGKVDSWTLIKIYEQTEENEEEKQPSSIFLAMISKYLGHSLKNINRIKKFTFEELGGNSILFTLITNELKDSLKYDLPSEFISSIYNQSLEKCLNFLDNWKNDKGSANDEELEEIMNNRAIKRIKYTKNIEVIWKFNLFGCVDASPLVFEREGKTYVVVGSFSNFFVILDAVTGERKYLEKFPDSIGNQASVSPCSNFLYFGCFDGRLYCIDLKNYTIAWSYQTNDSIKCKPNFCLNHKAVVFGSYDKHVHCVRIETGKIIWKTSIQESIVTIPLIHKKNKEIIVTTLSSSCISLSEDTGEILWRIKLKNPIFSSPHLRDNNMICCDVLGNIYSINLDTKHHLVVAEIEGEIFSAIKYVHNNFIVASTRGLLYKCEMADDNSVADIQSLDLGNAIPTTPAVFEIDEKTLAAAFTSTGEFYLVNLGNMEIIHCWKCPGEVYSSCVFHDNKIFVGCRDDNLYCLEMANT